MLRRLPRARGVSPCLLCVLVLLGFAAIFVVRIVLGRVDGRPLDVLEWADTMPAPRSNVWLVIMNDESPRVRPYADASVLNKRAYSKKHGYGLLVVPKRLDPVRHVVWSKLVAVHAACKMQPRAPEWVVWMDLDTYILQQDQPVMDLWPERTKKRFLGVADVDGPLNAGLFAVRCDAQGLGLLHEAYGQWTRELFWFARGRMNREQDALASLLHPKQDVVLPYGRAWRLARGEGVFMVHYCNCVDGGCAAEMNAET